MLSIGNIFLISAIVVLLIYSLYRHREMTKKLTLIQMIGVIISYIVTIFIAFLLIYYVGNWLVSFITAGIPTFVIQVIIIIVVISLCTGALNKVLRKITKGIIDR